VGRCSAHWGQVIRDDFNWNHADEINQVLGVKRTEATDTLAFYRTHVNRLKEAGL
jgi:triacylglycerol lipase